MDTQYILNQIREITFSYGPKVIGAIVVFILGWWLIKGFTKSFSRMLEKRHTDESLRPFLRSIMDATLKVLLIISVFGMLGIEMTSFIAILGAAGLAVGMALSGSLQNFAGGVMILLFKPFKVGDNISAQGHIGTVKEIQIFNTILKTPDNKTIIIPNGGLSTGSMTNFSTEKQRRIEWIFGMAYGDDVDKAKAVLRDLCYADNRILKVPDVMVAVNALNSSSVDFVVRAWVDTDNYWEVFFEMNEKVYKQFPAVGLNIPFPQMDVYIKNKS